MTVFNFKKSKNSDFLQIWYKFIADSVNYFVTV